jgi:predicted dehydrogenase
MELAMIPCSVVIRRPRTDSPDRTTFSTRVRTVKVNSILRNPARIAVVGCGAVSEVLHFPALRRNPGCEVVALVDRNEDRAERFGAELGVEHICRDHHELLELDLDGAIVALPTNFHAPVSADLLRAGIHVLVEKPVARTLEECDEMIMAGDEGGAALAVGLPRRFAHQCRFAKWAIDSGLLGAIRSFDVRDGYGFSWPVKTDFPFRKEAAGGGVLIDLGVHTLDLLAWWFGDLQVIEHRDNDLGGVESESLTRFASGAGLEGTAEFSWTRRLRNTIVVSGERGSMEVCLTSNKVTLEPLGGPGSLIGPAEPPNPFPTHMQTPVDLTLAEQVDWLDAARSGRAPAVSGAEARRSLALILDCYAGRRPLTVPWIEATRKEGVSA